MLAYPSMIADIAKEVGMKVPKNPDGEWDGQKYVHFAVLCNVTLGRPIRWGSARSAIEVNAKMIATIPPGTLKKMTLGEIRSRCVELV